MFTCNLFLFDVVTDSKMRRRSQYDNHHHSKEYGALKKYSSCSTIFIDDSTVSQPNLKNTLKAVALAIYFHIRNREHKENNSNSGVHVDQINILDIFDEKLHPLSVRNLFVSLIIFILFILPTLSAP